MGHEVADADALQIFYSITDVVEHIADLAFVSLGQNDADPSFAERSDAFGDCQPVLESNPTKHALNMIVVKSLVQSDVVLLLDFVFRMGEVFGDISGIAQQNEAVAVQIETSNMGQMMKGRRQKL